MSDHTLADLIFARPQPAGHDGCYVEGGHALAPGEQQPSAAVIPGAKWRIPE
jgi:hypothetical protein